MSVCLCMVVKNESKYLHRSLSAIKPFIDRWSVVDTGSTDDTKDIIRKELEGIPGELHERPWKNWGHNRTESIQLATQQGCDFIFLLDADEKPIIPEDFNFKALSPEIAYWVTIQYGPMTYGRPNVLSKKYKWEYVGVTHEYLTPVPDNPPTFLLPITLETAPERADKTPEKCKADAELLEEALKTEPENSRYWFYCAQSYRDCGEYQKSLEYYEKRSTMGGWDEEVFYSLLMVADLKARLKYAEGDIIIAFLRAYQQRPIRSEALGAAARYARLCGHYHLAYMFARQAVEIPLPQDRLFLATVYYEWRNLDELSIAAYWVGKYRESLELCNVLLNSGKLPESEIPRVQRNKKFAEDKLAPPTAIQQPTVSAIMLTKDRPQYVPQAIGCFLKQTYPHKELIIVDDGSIPIKHLIPPDDRIKYHYVDEPNLTIGKKRNIGIGFASGDVIMTWDDDDWSAANRMGTQVARLKLSGKQLTGYNEILYYNEPDGKTYRFVCKNPYAAGSSQCYWKSWWEKHPYPDMQSGEDRVMSAVAQQVGQLDYENGCKMLVARAHNGNTWIPPLGTDEMFPPAERSEFPKEFLDVVDALGTKAAGN